MQTAERTRKLTSFKVVDFLEAARRLEAEGRDTIHMESGEPCFATAAPILEAARLALDQGKTAYTPSCGIPELRLAIRGYYSRRYGVTVHPDRVIVPTGSSAALGMVLELLAHAGVGIFLADPVYPVQPHSLWLVEAAH